MPESGQNLVDEVKILEERLAEARRALEHSGEKPPQDRELVSKVVRQRMEENQPSQPPTPTTPPSTQAAPPTPPVKPVHDEMQEVQSFIAIAFEKDIPSAVDAARKTGNAHIVDALHDILVDKFYDELVKRGKVT